MTARLADQEKLMLIDRLDKEQKTQKRMKDRIYTERMQYLHIAETAMAEAAIGFYEGATGKDTLLDGIPLDLIVAGVGFGVGFFGVGEETAKHFYSVGTGGLGLFLYKRAKEMGAKVAAPSQSTSSQGVAGILPPHNPALSDAEISRLIDAARAVG